MYPPPGPPPSVPPDGPQYVGPAPLQPKELSPGMRLLVLTGFVLLTLVLIIGLVSTIALGIAGLSRGTFLPALVAAGVTLAAGAAAYKLYPLVSRPARFTPSYGAIPYIPGHPFEVRYGRARGRTLGGKGRIGFQPQGLYVEGTLSPHPGLQLGVVLTLTILPLILFQFGLGLLPALLIAYLIGRKRLQLWVPFQQISSAQLRGNRLTLQLDGVTPKRIDLFVSYLDGSRLHQELVRYVPALQLPAAPAASMR